MMTCCPKVSPRRLCTMRAITSVPPPGGYGTMKRTGLVGQSCASAGSAASRPRTTASPLIMTTSYPQLRTYRPPALRLLSQIAAWLCLYPARECFDFVGERVLHRAVLALHLGHDLPRLVGIRAARRGFQVRAIATQRLGAHVRTARLERMRRRRDVGRVGCASRLLQLLQQLRRLGEVEVDHTRKELRLAVGTHLA